MDDRLSCRLHYEIKSEIPCSLESCLNQTKGWTEALYNIATGEYTFKVYTEKKLKNALVHPLLANNGYF